MLRRRRADALLTQSPGATSAQCIRAPMSPNR